MLSRARGESGLHRESDCSTHRNTHSLPETERRPGQGATPGRPTDRRAVPAFGTALVMDCGTLSLMTSTHSLGKKPTWRGRVNADEPLKSSLSFGVDDAPVSDLCAPEKVRFLTSPHRIVFFSFFLLLVKQTKVYNLTPKEGKSIGCKAERRCVITWKPCLPLHQVVSSLGGMSITDTMSPTCNKQHRK